MKMSLLRTLSQDFTFNIRIKQKGINQDTIHHVARFLQSYLIVGVIVFW